MPVFLTPDEIGEVLAYFAMNWKIWFENRMRSMQHPIRTEKESFHDAARMMSIDNHGFEMNNKTLENALKPILQDLWEVYESKAQSLKLRRAILQLESLYEMSKMEEPEWDDELVRKMMAEDKNFQRFMESMKKEGGTKNA